MLVGIMTGRVADVSSNHYRHIGSNQLADQVRAGSVDVANSHERPVFEAQLVFGDATIFLRHQRVGQSI